jgi:mRNA interferase RelE/StbE
MIYELHFYPLALKEWKKLAKGLQKQFKKSLKRRLENPHIISASLRGSLKDLQLQLLLNDSNSFPDK